MSKYFRVIGQHRGVQHYVVVERTGRIAVTTDPDNINRPARPVPQPPAGVSRADIPDNLQRGLFSSVENAIAIAAVAAVQFNLTAVQTVEVSDG